MLARLLNLHLAKTTTEEEAEMTEEMIEEVEIETIAVEEEEIREEAIEDLEEALVEEEMKVLNLK
jgi:hypothetical protein